MLAHYRRFQPDIFRMEL